MHATQTTKAGTASRSPLRNDVAEKDSGCCCSQEKLIGGISGEVGAFMKKTCRGDAAEQPTATSAQTASIRVVSRPGASIIVIVLKLQVYTARLTHPEITGIQLSKAISFGLSDRKQGTYMYCIET
jgi:hypothetical protein